MEGPSGHVNARSAACQGVPRPGDTQPCALSLRNVSGYWRAASGRPGMQWISNNSQWLNVIIQAGMLLVWMFYAQLLLSSFRRSRRAKLILDQGTGRGLKSLCLMANMSSESVFIQVVVAALYNEEDRVSRDITDVKVRSRDEDAGAEDGVSGQQAEAIQGPLQSGSYVELGTFGDIIDSVMHKREDTRHGERERYADQYSLELTIIVTFGPENQPIGFRRCFEFSRSETGIQLVRATTIDTQRLAGPRDRRQMRRWLQQYL